MPIITKPSEALKLALKIVQMETAPWASYSTKRGGNQFTCNALDYLVEAEEVTEEASKLALAALYPNSCMAKSIFGKPSGSKIWFWPEFSASGHELRIAAINKTIEELESKGQ